MTNSRKARIRRQRQRRALLTMALVLVTAFACIGGTIAWLTAETVPVTNTFTVGDINIELKEHDYEPGENGAVGKLNEKTEVITENDYKMVPGVDLPKDPFVRVLAKSEDCYVFVEVVEANNTNPAFISYTVDSTKWEELTGVTGKYDGKVYAYKSVVNYNAAPQELSILTGNKVTVNSGITKAQMEAVTNNPTLTFYGYAVQEEGSANAAAAWAKLNG